MHAITERLRALHVPPATLRRIDDALAHVHDTDIDLAAFLVGRHSVTHQIADLPNPFKRGSDDAELWSKRFTDGAALQNQQIAERQQLRRQLGYRTTAWG